MYVELRKWQNIQIEISRTSCIYKANAEFIEQESTFSDSAYVRVVIFGYLLDKRSSQRNSVQREEAAHLYGPRGRKDLQRETEISQH